MNVVREITFDVDTKNMPGEYENSRHFTATYDNIDFNKHVTQATYVRWVTNSLSYEFLKGHELREVEIVYEHEVLPDNKVNSENHVIEESGKVKVYHRVRNEEGDKTHCWAVSIWERLKEMQ